MEKSKDYFFCGIGGSGMLPLAVIVKAAGHRVEGSDRALDQGRTGAKFDYLERLGIGLYAQDGSGVVRPEQIIVASAAVEETVPDIAAASQIGALRVTRPELLSSLFNVAPRSIGVAGTSGKSTTTAMIAWILDQAGVDPTVMNGAVMKNFVDEDAPFASARIGSGDVFVSEVDESDGSIAGFNPTIAVLNNVALDHKSMDELRALFGGFVDRSDVAVLNLDHPETAALADKWSKKALTYSLEKQTAGFMARNIEPRRFGVAFEVVDRARGAAMTIELKMPGRHNVSNALAAIAAASACNVDIETSSAALSSFEGVRRRLEYVGEASGVTVIDDFAHNPDKITASLKTLHEFPGRLLIMFQPHGFGPLKKMKNEFIAAFSDNLQADDVLIMPDPAYFGGTVDRSVSSADIAAGVVATGKTATALQDRDACRAALLEAARSGDRIIVMGARDDTLSTFAAGLLDALAPSA